MSAEDLGNWIARGRNGNDFGNCFRALGHSEIFVFSVCFVLYFEELFGAQGWGLLQFFCCKKFPL